MIFTETRLQGAFIIDIDRHGDDRGFFARSFCRLEFAEHGLKPLVAQCNVSFNAQRGIVRGLHFQFPPAAETKYIRCTRGAVLDVIVDLRPESATYLQHVGVELTAENRRGLYAPERFAHGYQVLVDDTETTYQVGEFYTPAAECGLRHDDPGLSIPWPLTATGMSAKDRAWPLLKEAEPDIRLRMAVTRDPDQARATGAGRADLVRSA
jgi:dTDP-4-dehydrorhamnose 3,5-epimerase